jgi:hypothetical protein
MLGNEDFDSLLERCFVDETGNIDAVTLRKVATAARIATVR